MARKLCSICKIRPKSADTTNGLYCLVCDEEAGWENAHSDENHDDPQGSDSLNLANQVDACWICHPEFNPNNGPVEVKTGHTNTVAKTNTSHADHNHPRTPAARALCRKSMASIGQPYDIKKN